MPSMVRPKRLGGKRQIIGGPWKSPSRAVSGKEMLVLRESPKSKL